MSTQAEVDSLSSESKPSARSILWDNLKQGVWQGIIILIVAVVLALAFNALRPERLPLLAKPELAKPSVGVTSISLTEALKLYHERGAVFIDARDPYLFEQAHIPGAINVLPGKSAAVMSTLAVQKGRPVVAYCDGPECGAAEQLAKELDAQGVTGVRVMTEGWYAWSNAGYPMEGSAGGGK